MSEKGRRLLTPDEVLRLPMDEQLLFVRGRHPIRARKLDYLRDGEFAGLYGVNPMHDEVAPPDVAGPGASPADVPVGVSLLAIAGFTALCLAVVWWIFRTGWRLRR